MNAKAQRNDPCPCGSGKKYKKCCGLKEAENAQTRMSTMHTLQKFSGMMGAKNLKDTVFKVISGGGMPFMPSIGNPLEMTNEANDVNAEMFPEAIPDDLLPPPENNAEKNEPKSLS